MLRQEAASLNMRTLSIAVARIAALAAGIALTGFLLRATTLQYLSLDDMIQQSTGIVRAKVTGSYTAVHGADIDTMYQLQVLETLKPSPGLGTAQIAVSVPGGVAKGLRQAVPGAPQLTNGAEYVVFLWTGRSGITQIIGLSQGLFRATSDSSGDSMLVRPAASELMLDKNGKPVAGPPASLRLSDLRARIRAQGAGK